MKSGVLGKFDYLAVIWKPVQTVRSRAATGKFLPPLVTAGLLSATIQVLMVERLGFERLIAAALQIQGLEGEGVLAVLKAQELWVLGFQFAFNFTAVIATTLVGGTLIWLVIMVLGLDAPWRRVLTVCALSACFVEAIKQGMLLALVLINPNAHLIRLGNPLATNLAFFFRPASRYYRVIFEELDLLTVTNVGLIVVGLRASVQDSKRRDLILAAGLPWLLWIGVRFQLG